MVYITEKLRINRIDNMNITLEILKERKNSKTNEKKSFWKIKGYYGNLKQAFTSALYYLIENENNKVVKSIEDVITAIKNAEQLIINVVEDKLK